MSTLNDEQRVMMETIAGRCAMVGYAAGAWREATEATTRAIAIVRAREEGDSNSRAETDAVEEPTSPRARSLSSPRAGNLRGDMDALERELSQLTQSMRAALAEVDGVAP